LSERRIIAAVAAAFLLAGCSRQAEQGPAVAKVDDQPLTLAMVRSMVDTTRGISEAQVQSLANQWIVSELLYQEAKKRGLESADDVLKKVEDAKRQLAIAALLDREVLTGTASSLDPAEVERYYNGHKDEWRLSGTLRRLSFAVFADMDDAKEFRSGAIEGKGWVETLKQFRTSGRLISAIDSMFYTRSELYPPELWKVAQSLGSDEVSFPVKTSAGYFVLMLLGEYAEETPAPLAYVEDEIRNRLLIEQRQKRYADFIEQLRRQHTVQLNLSGAATGSDTTNAAAE
jgi:hypothetical protein